MGITHFCFGLSYLTALGMDLWPGTRPSRWPRFVSIAFSVAGLFAHTVFLILHQPSPASAYGSLLLLAWVFAVLYTYGNLHPKPYSWTIFVLPLVLLFVALSLVFVRQSHDEELWFSGDHFWGMIHGTLILLASVGITLAAICSLMYLIQDFRLRKKRNPFGGLKLLSLERLETINRRAINVAFPLLSVGLLLGAMRLSWDEAIPNWSQPKIIGTLGLWLVGAALLYLRYGAHLPGRRLAWLTIGTFFLLMVALLTAHPYAHGGGR